MLKKLVFINSFSFYFFTPHIDAPTGISLEFLFLKALILAL